MDYLFSGSGRLRSAAVRAFFTVLLLAGAGVLVCGKAMASSVLFGPKTFTLSSGAPQTFSEPVNVDSVAACDGKAAFTLVVTNGGGDAKQTVSSGSIAVNGLTVIRESDLQSGAPMVARPIALGATNSLTVVLKGGARGGFITVEIRKQIEVPVTSPQIFTIDHGKTSFDATFPVTGTSGAFALRVQNGDASGGHRVRGASIALNGASVLSQHDFDPGLYFQRIAVPVRESNALHVELNADPGGFLAITVIRVADESECGPIVAFTAPAEGTTIQGTSIEVAGTVIGSNDLGIVVNGAIASADLSHAGTAADPIPWSASVIADNGPVTLSAVATDGNGRRGRASRSIVFQAVPELIKLTPITAHGIAPFECTFQVDTRLDPSTLRSYSVDLDGNATPDGSGASLPESITFQYATPGVYHATLRAMGTDGIEQRASTTVTVESFATIDLIVRSRWLRLRDAFARQDVESAVSLFAGAEAQQKYRDVFTKLFDRLPAIGASMERPWALSVNGDQADYLVRRVENGVTMGYHMSLVRDADGVWRIADF